MKILHISDTHGSFNPLKLEGVDVIVHSGDFFPDFDVMRKERARDALRRDSANTTTSASPSLTRSRPMSSPKKPKSYRSDAELDIAQRVEALKHQVKQEEEALRRARARRKLLCPKCKQTFAVGEATLIESFVFQDDVYTSYTSHQPSSDRVQCPKCGKDSLHDEFTIAGRPCNHEFWETQPPPKYSSYGQGVGVYKASFKDIVRIDR